MSQAILNYISKSGILLLCPLGLPSCSVWRSTEGSGRVSKNKIITYCVSNTARVQEQLALEHIWTWVLKRYKSNFSSRVSGGVSKIEYILYVQKT